MGRHTVNTTCLSATSLKSRYDEFEGMLPRLSSESCHTYLNFIRRWLGQAQRRNLDGNPELSMFETHMISVAKSVPTVKRNRLSDLRLEPRFPPLRFILAFRSVFNLLSVPFGQKRCATRGHENSSKIYDSYPCLVARLPPLPAKVGLWKFGTSP